VDAAGGGKLGLTLQHGGGFDLKRYIKRELKPTC